MTQRQRREIAPASPEAVNHCDDTQCVQVGQLLGADLVIDGSITKVGSNFILLMRLVETKPPGRELASAEARGKNVDGLLDAAGPAVAEVLGPLVAIRRRERGQS